jgi:hypothetical protein
MPAPIVYAICELAITAGAWAWRGYQAYEAAQTAREAVEMARSVARSREEIARKFKDIIGSMASEIDQKSSTFALVDSGGKSTVSRRGDENRDWKEYIERKLPFRPAISVVCELALASPITVPRRIRSRIPGDVVETTIEMKLKQTTASIMFETIDSMLDWKCPLKAEPNYSKSTQAAYLGTPPTRPKRFNDVFTFWPRPRGSLAPDLVIVEYRQKPFEIDNVFAAVEIKFPGDWVQDTQMKDYVRLMTPRKGADAARIGQNRVALLRVPEDCIKLARNSETDTSKDNPAKHNRYKGGSR